MTRTRELHERAYKVTHTIKDIYKFYKNEKKDNGEKYLDERTFKRILYATNRKISKSIIENALDYKMSWKMGYLRIKKNKIKYKFENGRLKPRKKLIDWGESWKMWHRLYPGKTRKEINEIKGKSLVLYTNEHTNGEVMRWYWDKKMCIVPNKTSYIFQPVKQNRVKLKNWINNGNYDKYQF